MISAEVKGIPERRDEDGRIKAVLKNLKVTDTEGSEYHVKAAYWTYYPAKDSELPLDGQKVTMEASVYHPMSRQNPQGFNFKLYLLQQGITVGVSGARDLLMSHNEGPAPLSLRLRVSLWLSNLYDKTMGEGGELIRALLWGDRSDIGDEVEQGFKDAGIIHVLSISGLHVSILTGIFIGILKVLGLSPKQRFFFVVGILALYCMLLDFKSPVLRSAVMSVVFLGGRLYNERSDPLTSLSIAFMLILAVRPLDLFHVGFQLSFLAVLGIFTLGEGLNHIYKSTWGSKKESRKLDGLVFAMQTTVAATAFTMPVLINVFNRISLIGLLFSPIACLIIGIMIAYGLAILPLAMLSIPMAQIVSLPLKWSSLMFIKVTGAVSRLPYASINAASIGMVSAGLCFIVFINCTRYVRAGRFRGRLVGIALSLLILFGVTMYERGADMEHVRYTLFSSGNADAAVIEDGERTYLIDAAEHGGDLSNYLLSKGRDIDILFLSHLHRDHIGGLIQLIDRKVGIRQIVLPQSAEETAVSDDSHEILRRAKEAGIQVQYASRGDVFQSGRVRFEVLWPVYGKMYPGMDANHNSMALRVNMDGVSLLTAGDLTQEYEMYSALPAQLLKLAHHGAKGSTSLEYLHTASPQMALLTANRARMQYASATLKRLDGMNIPLWGTQEGSAVIISVLPQGKLSVRHYTDRGI